MAKTWLITGSSRGFGRELATAVLRGGDNVVATARKPEQLADLLDAYGDRVRTVALDVVVNNAGYANSVPIEEMTDDDFRQQVDANFFGVVNVTRAALPILREQRSGCFVQFSSVGGRVGGTPGLSAYQAAKFAVEGFSEVLAAEVSPFGVKVLIVEPGAFRTDWQGSSMRRSSVGPDYEATVGAMNRYREDSDGTQPGDPARAARIIMDVVAAEDAPLRLLLGAGAVEMAEKSSRERAAEALAWADVSRSADFPAGG